MTGFTIRAPKGTRILVAGLLIGTGLFVGAMNLDAETWSSIETALYWILGGALLVGFVALMFKYPKLARAIQTVMLIFIAIETLTELLHRPDDR